MLAHRDDEGQEKFIIIPDWQLITFHAALPISVESRPRVCQLICSNSWLSVILSMYPKANQAFSASSKFCLIMARKYGLAEGLIDKQRKFQFPINEIPVFEFDHRFTYFLKLI